MCRLAGFLLAVLGGAGSFFACDYDAYPIGPTFCDNWCRAFMRLDCDQEPENCVRDCEASRASPQCREFEEQLAECYFAAPVEDFVCVGRGFRSMPRPQEGVCQLERDALVACEFPEVKLCFDFCRGAQASLIDEGATSAAGVGDADAEQPLVPAVSACPPGEIPCEALCWKLEDFANYLADNPDAAASPGLTALIEQMQADAVGADVLLFGALISCAVERANACYGAEQDGSLEQEAVPDWESILWDCAADLD